MAVVDLSDKIPGWGTGKWEVPEWSFDGNPCLIINHMQKGIAGSGKFSGAPFDQEVEAMKKFNTIENQKKLIAAFRERNLPIIWISVIPNPFGKVPKWGVIFEMNKACAPVGHLDNPEMLECVQIMDELGRLPSEPLVCHTGHSPMTGNNLDDMLKQMNVHDIVLTGWTIHSTLYNSLLQFTNHWYSVVVPKDCSGSPKQDEDCMYIAQKMMRMYGLVTTMDDVIAHLPDNK